MLYFALFYIAVIFLCGYGFLSMLHLPRSGKLRLVKVAVSLAYAIIAYYLRLLALVMMHLLVLQTLCLIAGRLLRRFVKPGKTLRWIYKTAAVPVLLVSMLLLWGYSNMNTVVQTRYTVTSPKLTEEYKLVFLSDVHFGTVQSPSLLAEKVEEINALSPDMVVLGGDILDEGTSKAEMELCFETLGKLRPRYGIYAVYGNHDRQRYMEAPAFTEAEQASAMVRNGITPLQDTYVSIGSDLMLLGREDLGAGHDRKAPQGETGDRFLLTVDHQPTGTRENAALGTDLQISGHTHGGQIFPLGYLTFFNNGYVYGRFQEGDMTILVSSGFAGWGFSVRTQGVSEYVVVDLLPQ